MALHSWEEFRELRDTRYVRLLKVPYLPCAWNPAINLEKTFLLTAWAETRHFTYFYLGHCAILLFKTQWATPSSQGMEREIDVGPTWANLLKDFTAICRSSGLWRECYNNSLWQKFIYLFHNSEKTDLLAPELFIFVGGRKWKGYDNHEQNSPRSCHWTRHRLKYERNSLSAKWPSISPPAYFFFHPTTSRIPVFSTFSCCPKPTSWHQCSEARTQYHVPWPVFLLLLKQVIVA